MEISNARKQLTPQQAEELLPDTDVVHTFRTNTGHLIGADWPRDKIVQRFRTNGVELSGESAARLGHGLCSIDEALGPLFIETRKQRKAK